MLITDSQVHVWGAKTAARSWLAGRDHEAQKPDPVTQDMLLFEMELAKVDRIVLVPPSWAIATTSRWAPHVCALTASQHNRHFLTEGTTDWLSLPRAVAAPRLTHRRRPA